MISKFKIINKEDININGILEYIKYDLYSEYEISNTSNIFTNVRDDEEILYYIPSNFSSDFLLHKYLWFCRLQDDPILKLSDIKIIYIRNKSYFNLIDSYSYNNYYWNEHIINYKFNYNTLFVPHWGWTDFVISNGLINYYSSLFTNVLIGCMPCHKLFLENLFPNNQLLEFDWFLSSNAKVIIQFLFENDYIFLIDGHQGTQNIAELLNSLNLIPKTKIQYLNIVLLKDNILNYNYFPCNTNTSLKILEIKEMSDNPLYKLDERLTFYTSVHIPYLYIIKYFKLYRNTILEINFKLKHITNDEEYIIIHHIPEMHDNYFTGKKCIYLNNISESIIETLLLIEDAKEIHIYDSLYGLLIYLLYFSSNFFHNKKIYYHRYARQKIPKIYTLIPFTNDWIILD